MKEPLLPLVERLFQHPYEFNFFQAVKLLTLIRKDLSPVGQTAKPEDEVVRFKVRQSFEFPASSIHDLTGETNPPQMTVAFLGLTGVQGVLPTHYTEHIVDRSRSDDFAMAEFFDLFNHRIIALFYRAWEKHRFPVRYQLAAAHRAGDYTQYLFDFIGLGTKALQGRLAVQDSALLRYAGLFAQKPASASGLQAILRDYFRAEVEIHQFQGAWCTLDKEDQCDLNGIGLNNELGEGAIAGDAVWDPQARIRIRVGPLPLDRFLAFLPGGSALPEINDLARFYLGPILEFDLQLVLRAEEVPWCRIGDDSESGPRLGWCGWLKTEPFLDDARVDLAAQEN